MTTVFATAPSRACAYPGCSAYAVARGYCQPHAQIREAQRPNVTTRRWYFTARWRRLRAQVLFEEPLCRACGHVGRVEGSVDVDHRTPHRGSADLFWARANLQALCHACHSTKTQRGE